MPDTAPAYVLLAAGEMLHMAEPFLEKNIHPTVIVRGFARALEDSIKIIDQLAFPIDTNDRKQLMNVVNSCIGTKFTHRFGTLMAVSTTLHTPWGVAVGREGSRVTLAS